MILYREKGKVPLEHYFTNNENLKSELRKLIYNYENINFEFFSDNGVFAKNKIDYASKLLVESFIKEKHDDKSDGDVFDVGCGYGFIGIVISILTNSYVDMIDVNKRAIHLTNRNIKRYPKFNGNAFISDAYTNIKNKYNVIITNPPIRVGKTKLLEILEGAFDHLEDNGILYSSTQA